MLLQLLILSKLLSSATLSRIPLKHPPHEAQGQLFLLSFETSLTLLQRYPILAGLPAQHSPTETTNDQHLKIPPSKESQHNLISKELTTLLTLHQKTRWRRPKKRDKFSFDTAYVPDRDQ
jgi:hypothetical protein